MCQSKVLHCGTCLLQVEAPVMPRLGLGWVGLLVPFIVCSQHSTACLVRSTCCVEPRYLCAVDLSRALSPGTLDVQQLLGRCGAAATPVAVCGFQALLNRVCLRERWVPLAWRLLLLLLQPGQRHTVSHVAGVYCRAPQDSLCSFEGHAHSRMRLCPTWAEGARGFSNSLIRVLGLSRPGGLCVFSCQHQEGCALPG